MTSENKNRFFISFNYFSSFAFSGHEADDDDGFTCSYNGNYRETNKMIDWYAEINCVSLAEKS